MALAHALDAGYRTAGGTLSSILTELVRTLASSLETAVRLFEDLQRVQFPERTCPIDGAPLCS